MQAGHSSPPSAVAGMPADWPAPDPDAAALGQRLADLLHARILDDGRLPFDAWMEAVLYEPGLGYYSAGQEKFGAAGDFVTAPGISPLFARSLAGQCAEALTASEGDTILELGGGDGAMAAELLAELERQGRLPAHYWLLERSASLRQRQQETIEAAVPHLLDRVEWLDQPPRTPIRGVILGNEVLDALPVARFRRGADGCDELFVTVRNGGFDWDVATARPRVAEAVAGIEADLGAPLPEGYLSEVCLQLPGFMATLVDCLASGLVLMVDYGYPRREYYRTDRNTGTVVCHYRHRAHWDPLLLPGLQDVTAFVDFTGAALGAQDAGLTVLGYASQAHFLMGAGITELLESSQGDDAMENARLAQQAKTLLLPGAMGERFRVLAAGTADIPAPSGFSLYNHIATL